jgi:hypothetical protein
MVDKTSSDELDYKSFLQELLSFRTTGSSSVDDSLREDGPMLAKKKRKPEEVYQELAFFDFPMLSPDELQVLARDMSETLKKQSHRGPISEEVIQLFQRFPLTKRFILGISEGAAKYIHRSPSSSSSQSSKDHENEITTENKPSETPPVVSDVSWTAYSSLCATVFVKMLLILIK